MSSQAQGSACLQQVEPACWWCIQYEPQSWFAMKKKHGCHVLSQRPAIPTVNPAYMEHPRSATHLPGLPSKSFFRLDPSLQAELVMLSRVPLHSPRHI